MSTSFPPVFGYKRIRIWSALCLFFLFFFFYHHNLGHFEPFVFDTKNIVFASDTDDVVNMMILFSDRVEQFYLGQNQSLTSLKDMDSKAGEDIRKHLLFPAVTGPLVFLVKTLFSLGLHSAIAVVLAFFAALNVFLVFLFLERLIKRVGTALIFALFYGFLFSNVVFFSIPETYVLSNTLIIVCFYILVKFKEISSGKWVVFLFAITGLAPLLNLPLGLLLIPISYMFFRLYDSKKWLVLTGANVLIAVMTFWIVQSLVFGGNFYDFFVDYGGRFFALAFFLDMKNVLFYLACFLVFSVISPLQHPVDLLTLSSLLENLSLPGLGLSFFYLVFFLASSVIIFKKRNELRNALIVWILSMIIFYMFFNPWEQMLYTSQILLPLTLLLASAFAEMTHRYKHIILMLFVLATAIHNTLCLYRLKF